MQKTATYTLVSNTDDSPLVLDLTADDLGFFSGWYDFEYPAKTPTASLSFTGWNTFYSPIAQETETLSFTGWTTFEE